MNIRSLAYAYIGAKDPAQWLTFGTDVMGMMQAPQRESDDTVFLKMDERPFRLAISKAEQDSLLCCGWELATQKEFESAKLALTAAGVSYTAGEAAAAEERGVKEFIAFNDPSGNALELFWGNHLDYAPFISPVGLSEFVTGHNGDMGFGHVVLPVSDLEACYDFYIDVLGFGDTDRMHFKFSDDPADPGQGLRFLHCASPRHHSLALYEDANNPLGCVHLMVEVPEIDDVGFCLDRVQAREIPVVSTLGRHVNDKMLSFYMATPSGFAMEYGCHGLLVDWDNYTPTVSQLPSNWGHKFVG